MNYVVFRLPIEYKDKIKEAVKEIEKSRGFKINQNEFVRSAVDLKLKEKNK